MSDRGYAFTISFCCALTVTFLCVLGLSCQHHTAAVAQTCLEQGNAPLECDEIAIGG